MQVEHRAVERVGLHVGRREHYRLARDLLADAPERVVLVQRSSTLLLGPEAGWDFEADFHRAALASIAAGSQWYHVASVRGIERHVARVSSSFPERRQAKATVVVDGVVAILRARGDPQPVKVLPDEADLRTIDGANGSLTQGAADDHSDQCGFLVGDVKYDRQIRMIAAESDGRCTALVVSDIGDQQLTIRLTGEVAQRLFAVVVEFYDRCPPLLASELDRLMSIGEREVAV